MTRPVSALPPGIALGRYAESLRLGSADYQDQPQIAHALDLRKKAAIGGMTTAETDMATVGIWDEGMARLLATTDAFEAAARGGRMREVPFATAVPRELDTGTTGFWVEEGAARPLISYLFDLVGAALSDSTNAIGSLQRVFLTREGDEGQGPRALRRNRKAPRRT